MNILEHELESFGQVARTYEGNPVLGEVRHYLNAATPEGPATLYICDSPSDALAAHQAGCYAIYVNPDSDEPAEGAVMSVLSGESSSVVFDALLDIAQRYGEWESNMDMLRLSGGTLQDMLDISEPFLRNNVVVLDPALKLLAYTKGIPCDDPITVELIEHGYHTQQNISKFKLNKRFRSWSEDEGLIVNDTHTICKYTTIARSFKTKSSFSLISVMMCNVSNSLDYISDVFTMFTDRVEYFALRDYPDDKPTGNMVDTFLKDLLSGSLNDEAVVERSQFVAIPSSGHFCLFYFEPDAESAPVNRLLSDTSMTVAPAKTIMMDNAIVVLCFNCVSDACVHRCHTQSCPHTCHTVSARLDEMLARYELTCGRSSKFIELSQADKAYEQARESYALSKRGQLKTKGASANSWPRIFSFDRYSVDYLVSELSDRARDLLGFTYASSIINAISHQDENAHTNNYEFLYTYLMHERRTSAVAEQLHMHRNNVGYRIGRIEEQFGIDINDPQLRADLLLAFRLREAALVQNAQEQGPQNWSAEQ